MVKTIDATPIEKVDTPIDANKIVDAAEAEFVAGQVKSDQTAVAQAEAAPALPPPPVRKVLIYYDLVRKDGSQGKNRFAIDYAADVRLLSDILAIERNIVAASNGELISAFITNWKSLEG